MIKKQDYNKVKKNYSTAFVLPMLGFNYQWWINNRLYNTYIEDVNKTEEKNKIYVLLDFSGSVDFSNSLEQLEKHKNFSYSYPICHGTYIMNVFNPPIERQNDLEMFKRGKYSKMSDEYKLQILSFFGFDHSRKYLDVVDKKEKPSTPQVLYPKDSDRKFYIGDRYKVEYEKDAEILEGFEDPVKLKLEIFNEKDLDCRDDTKIYPKS